MKASEAIKWYSSRLQALLPHVSRRKAPIELMDEIMKDAGKIADSAVSMLRIQETYQATRDRCAYGHGYMRLADHPMRDGSYRCPHCMAQGLDRLRDQVGLLAEIPRKPT